jgi:hypothetical protein
MTENARWPTLEESLQRPAYTLAQLMNVANETTDLDSLRDQIIYGIYEIAMEIEFVTKEPLAHYVTGQAEKDKGVPAFASMTIWGPPIDNGLPPGNPNFAACMSRIRSIVMSYDKEGKK